MKITVVGGGYVGLVSGACLSKTGHSVTIIDTIPQKVEMINSGKPPIYEIGLDEILKSCVGKNLCASLSYDSVAESDISLICVGTPPREDGSANLEYIESAARSIGEEIGKAESRGIHKFRTVIVKSTVPPGTTENIVIPAVMKGIAAAKAKNADNSANAEYAENTKNTENVGNTENTENTVDSENIGFAMNPEFLREGLAVEDFLNPDRIVIGSSSEKAKNAVTAMYEGIGTSRLYCGITAAEMIKYTSNAFLATKISFSNEIGNICKRLGIDVYEVMKGVGMDHRISPFFLNAGAGFGGSCFPKDVSALVSLAESSGEDPVLLKSVLEVNEVQPLKMIELLEKRIGDIAGKHIAVLGLAFKNDTDDIRDSRSIPVLEELIRKGAKITAYDPMATGSMKKVFDEDKVGYCASAKDALMDADACLVMTEWPMFTELDSEFDVMKSRIIIEGRRILSVKDKEGICW